MASFFSVPLVLDLSAIPRQLPHHDTTSTTKTNKHDMQVLRPKHSPTLFFSRNSEIEADFRKRVHGMTDLLDSLPLPESPCHRFQNGVSSQNLHGPCTGSSISPPLQLLTCCFRYSMTEDHVMNGATIFRTLRYFVVLHHCQVLRKTASLLS